MKTTLLVNVLVLLLLGGCSNPEKAFQKAKGENTIDAYDKFLIKHSDGDRSQEAKDLICSLAYDDALQENTIAAFNEYLETYMPGDLFVQKTILNICSLKFEEAKSMNTVGAYEAFIKECPESLEAETAAIKARELRPVAGTWLGNDIQFNVSLDGKSIWKTNSKLENTCSITLKIRTAGYSMQLFLQNEIQISNHGSFSLKYLDSSYDSPSGYVSIEGEFSSPTEASGTFSFTDFGRNQINGSTNWRANPKK